MDPVDALIGVTLLGLGVVMMYGSYKNRRVFGAEGLIPEALSKGSVTNLPSTQAVPTIGGRSHDDAPPRTSATRAHDAIATIATRDPALADNIEAQLDAATGASSRQDLMPLAQLLAVADAKGFSTAVIRSYVRELTGEAI